MVFPRRKGFFRAFWASEGSIIVTAALSMTDTSHPLSWGFFFDYQVRERENAMAFKLENAKTRWHSSWKTRSSRDCAMKFESVWMEFEETTSIKNQD
jgi:hypothetical protein